MDVGSQEQGLVAIAIFVAGHGMEARAKVVTVGGVRRPRSDDVACDRVVQSWPYVHEEGCT